MSATAKPYKLSRYGEHKGSYATLELAQAGADGLTIFHASSAGIVIDVPMDFGDE